MIDKDRLMDRWIKNEGVRKKVKKGQGERSLRNCDRNTIIGQRKK